MYIKHLFLPSCLLISSLFSASCFANIVRADAAYDAGQYAEAITEYQAAALVGNPRAQHTLGLMYYKGEGTAPDKVKAAIWFVLASESDYRDSLTVAKSIAKQLTEQEREQFKEQLVTIGAEYSQYAIRQNYFPEVIEQNLSLKIASSEDVGLLGLEDEDGLTDDVFDVAASDQSFFTEDEDGNQFTAISYSSFNSSKGMSERPYFIILDFVVAPDGSVRDFEVIQSFGYIDKALRKMREVKYPIPLFNNKPTFAHKRISLGIAQSNIRRNEMMEKYVSVYRGIKPVLAKGKTSDKPYDQYQYALALMNFPGLWQKPGQVEALLESAAKQGLVEAQYVYGSKLYREQKDIQQALHWFEEAAKQGLANSEYALGEIFVASPWVKADEKKASFWLERAAQQGHVFALRKSAELMLNATDESLRDPEQALVYLQRISQVEAKNPEVKYYTAKALLKTDPTQRPAAVDMMRDAIMRGDQIGWDTSEWTETLMRWTSGGRVTVQDDYTLKTKP